MDDTGLWDPWETHYGEVARNIVTRGDPMDLRYKPGYGPDGRRENQFRSKHALPFWGMAAGLYVFDSGDQDREDEMVVSSRPLWALRLPSMLMALWGVGALALALHRCVSPRAGWVCAWVLATMPQFLMMARQATTDIYALGPMALALGAWIQARYGPDEPLQRRRIGPLALPWDQCALGFLFLWLLMVGAPIFMLWDHVGCSRIIEMVANWPKKPTLPTVADLDAIAQAMLFYALQAVVLLVWIARSPRRSDLHVYTVYLAGGWALMGKGLLVPGLLAVVFVLDLVRRGELKQLLKLKPVSGILVFLLACVPWHHAMAIFRGDPWVHELLIENNLERFMSGEQTHAVGDLGYYLGVLLAATGVWVFIWPSSMRASHPVYGFAKLGALVSLAVISVSATKYHHYSAVTLPFLAIVSTGWFLNQVSPPASGTSRDRVAITLGLFVVGGILSVQLYQEPARMVHLTTYLSTGLWRHGAGDILPYLCVLGAAVLLRAAYLLWPRRIQSWFSPVFLGLAMASGWVLMLQYLPQSSRTWSQAEVIREYYQRKGPGDEIASWWFYHRGETFYTKRRIWVQATPDPVVLRKKIREMQEKPGDLWIVTNPLHLPRLEEHLPARLRQKLELVQQRPHQVLVRLPLK